MNYLNCDVQSCANNQNNKCALNRIQVDGPGACTSSQTCCSAFTAKGTATAQNSVVSSKARLETNIGCRAENCKYNKRQKCSAENVSMNSMTSSANVMGETECLSFNPR